MLVVKYFAINTVGALRMLPAIRNTDCMNQASVQQNIFVQKNAGERQLQTYERSNLWLVDASQLTRLLLQEPHYHQR